MRSTSSDTMECERTLPDFVPGNGTGAMMHCQMQRQCRAQKASGFGSGMSISVFPFLVRPSPNHLPGTDFTLVGQSGRATWRFRASWILDALSEWRAGPKNLFARIRLICKDHFSQNPTYLFVSFFTKNLIILIIA